MRQATISFVVLVRMLRLGPQLTDFHEICYLCICMKCVEKIHVPFKRTKMTGTLHEDVCTLMIIYGLIVVRMEMLRTKLS